MPRSAGDLLAYSVGEQDHEYPPCFDASLSNVYLLLGNLDFHNINCQRQFSKHEMSLCYHYRTQLNHIPYMTSMVALPMAASQPTPPAATRADCGTGAHPKVSMQNRFGHRILLPDPESAPVFSPRRHIMLNSTAASFVPGAPYARHPAPSTQPLSTPTKWAGVYLHQHNL